MNKSVYIDERQAGDQENCSSSPLCIDAREICCESIESTPAFFHEFLVGLAPSKANLERASPEGPARSSCTRAQHRNASKQPADQWRLDGAIERFSDDVVDDRSVAKDRSLIFEHGTRFATSE
ncbi:MAG: hypothetical protein MUD03_18090 [Pirellula sp.]|nr:hypothetical protein [Pirellula sp.]